MTDTTTHGTDLVIAPEQTSFTVCTYSSNMATPGNG